MATVTIIITDDPERGDCEVDVKLDFHGSFDPSSEAHTMAADMAMDLKQGETND